VLCVLVAAACGDDTAAPAGLPESGESPTTAEVSTTTTSTTVAQSSTTATTGPPACPDEGPLPADAEDVLAATVAIDVDGDGEPDELRTYRVGDGWRVRVDRTAGGSSSTAVPEAFMGARALGGHDLDGDGRDEVFVAVTGPAAGSLVAVLHAPGCALVPVVDAATAAPFVFPVTASIGTFSGATCDGIGDLDLVTGLLVDAEGNLYEAAVVPYRLTAAGEMEAGPGDGAVVDADEAVGLATLDCGDLRAAL